MSQDTDCTLSGLNATYTHVLNVLPGLSGLSWHRSEVHCTGDLWLDPLGPSAHLYSEITKLFSGLDAFRLRVFWIALKKKRSLSKFAKPRCCQRLNYLRREDTLIHFLPEVLWVFSMEGSYIHINSRRGAYSNGCVNSKGFVTLLVMWLKLEDISTFGYWGALCAPIWPKESEPAGMMRGLRGSEETVFLIIKARRKTSLNRRTPAIYNTLDLFD